MNALDRPWDWLPVGLYRTTPEGHLLAANTAFAAILGVEDAARLLGGDVAAFYLEPDERWRWRDQLEREGQVRGWEFCVRRGDGSVVVVRDSATVVRDETGRVLYYEGAIEDVSERHRSEEALRESEHFLETVISSVREGIVVYDRELRCRVWNRFMEELTGASAADVLGRPAQELFPELASRDVESCVRRALRGETAVAPDVLFASPSGGRRAWIASVYTPHTSVAGEILGVVGVVRDVSELRSSQEELNRLAHALRSISEGVCVSDLDERIFFVNDAWLRIYGYSREEMLGKHVSLVRPTEGQEETARRIASEAKQEGFRGEVINRRKDGTLFPVYLSASTVLDPAGHGVALIGVVTDLSERKRLEDQLRHSQKMEAVGRLAGGIAHDFNNLLTAINGYSELLLQRLPAGENEALRGDVEEIRRAGERAANLTRQLLAFSRRQQLQPRILDLNQVLRDSQGILAAAAGPGVELELDLADDLWRVRADPSGLEQVMLNLVINARDAMPEGGVVRLRTANRRLDEVPRGGARGGEFVLFEVHDSGHGMSAETRERVFEPFFTTKGPGKGTGLGLATVYGIVQQSEGHIEVDSAPGEGASFRVFLPRMGLQPVETRPQRVSVAGPGGAETVLLVEDEDTVRSLAREVLQRRGYQVVEARDGAEALELLEQRGAGAALVLTDMIMPRLGGVELGRRLRERHPALPVLFMSGYADTAGMQALRDEPGRLFLKKPFTPEALATAVRQALDGVGKRS